MGKKRSVSVNRISEILIEKRPNGFTSDFEENKKSVSEMIKLPSKAARNKIAGHITHRAYHGTPEGGRPEGEGDEEG